MSRHLRRLSSQALSFDDHADPPEEKRKTPKKKKKRTHTQNSLNSTRYISPVVALGPLSQSRILNRLALAHPNFFTKWDERVAQKWERLRFCWFITVLAIYPLTWHFRDNLLIYAVSPLVNLMSHFVLVADAIYIFQNDQLDLSHFIEMGTGFLNFPAWLIFERDFMMTVVLVKAFILRIRYNAMFYHWANTLFGSNRHMVRLFRLIFELAALLHVYTCYFYPEMEAEFETMTQESFKDAHNPPFERYMAALHWSVAKFCGADWLPLIPFRKRMNIIFYSMIAYFIEGSLLGSLLTMGTDTSANARYERVTEKTDTITTTGEALGFPQRLILKLAQYEIQLDLETGGSSLSEILDDLSMDVRREVFQYLMKDTFSKVKLFKNAPKRFITMTIGSMNIQPFAQGVELVEKDWPMDDYAVIISGEIEVLVGPEKKSVKVMKQGEAFGDVSLAKPLPEAVASAWLKSKTPGLLYTISRERMLEILDLFPKQKAKVLGQATKHQKDDHRRLWRQISAKASQRSAKASSNWSQVMSKLRDKKKKVEEEEKQKDMEKEEKHKEEKRVSFVETKKTTLRGAALCLLKNDVNGVVINGTQESREGKLHRESGNLHRKDDTDVLQQTLKRRRKEPPLKSILKRPVFRSVNKLQSIDGVKRRVHLGKHVIA